MYIGKHDELLILKDPVNEKGHSYNTEMLVTGVFDDYEAYQKYCKLKNVFTCAYEDILFLIIHQTRIRNPPLDDRRILQQRNRRKIKHLR